MSNKMQQMIAARRQKKSEEDALKTSESTLGPDLSITETESLLADSVSLPPSAVESVPVFTGEEKHTVTSAAAVMEKSRLENMQDKSTFIIPLEQIVVKKQIRKKEEMIEEEIREKADSIRQHGQLQPGVVRDLPDGRYLLVAGERRYRALQLLNKEDPLKFAFFRATVNNDGNALTLQLIENIQRKDLKPISEAEGIVQLMNEENINQGEAAKQLGKHESWVSRRLALLEHDEEIQEKLESGELKPNSKEVKNAKAMKEDGGTVDKKTSIPKVPVPKDTLLEVCQLLQSLAKQYGLEEVVIPSKPSNKELLDIVGQRTGELFIHVN